MSKVTTIATTTITTTTITSSIVPEIGDDEPALVEMVMTDLLVSTAPLYVAVTVSTTVPFVLPAVKVTSGPEVVFSAPRLPLSIDHAYEMPVVGHAPGEQVGVAVKP